MTYNVAPHIQAKLDAGDSVKFTVASEPIGKLATLEIWQFREIVAVGAILGEKVYRLPSGEYSAVLRFSGPLGTIGIFWLTTPSQPKSKREAEIREGHEFETIWRSLVL